ncbi:unnamed protein product [Notodromas monacha]|uniref:Alpha 1,4-glycosyltransferase domain-containing protein n=1 Tax=Notodromas monacha TaxID=399045 RepID=A0A7R9BZ03_9CRUS|nr:unnamed protein product [Notodromas monacha]CAG0923426.1 unnamed protein product [Notodromas monacha]
MCASRKIRGALSTGSCWNWRLLLMIVAFLFATLILVNYLNDGSVSSHQNNLENQPCQIVQRSKTNLKKLDLNRLIPNMTANQYFIPLTPEAKIINSKLDLSPFSPKKDKAKNAIYMMETSGRQLLSAKQLCSVESAARHHPSKTLVLLVTANAIVYPTLITLLLNKHENIIVRKIDVGRFLSTSPLKQMDIENTLKKSKYVTEHASDLMRFALLHEYGGIFLDLDMIVLKKLPEVANGVATANNGTFLNPAFIAFEKDHPVLLDCMNHISKRFSVSRFNGNGPVKITEAMRRWCNVTTLQPGMNCSNVLLYPVDNFTHLRWGIAENAFDESPSVSDQLVETLESRAYVFHYYNDRTRVIDANITGNSAVARLARKHCPLVAGFSGDWLWGFHDPGKGFQ